MRSETHGSVDGPDTTRIGACQVVLSTEEARISCRG